MCRKLIICKRSNSENNAICNSVSQVVNPVGGNNYNVIMTQTGEISGIMHLRRKSSCFL